MADAMAVQESAGFSENYFFEYHLCTLGRPADLMNNEQKQVALLESDNFGVEKRLILTNPVPGSKSRPHTSCLRTQGANFRSTPAPTHHGPLPERPRVAGP